MKKFKTSNISFKITYTIIRYITITCVSVYVLVGMDCREKTLAFKPLFCSGLSVLYGLSNHRSQI